MGRHSRKSSMSPSTGEFASYSSVFSHLQQDTAFGVRPEPNPKIIAADITDNADTQARINAWMVEHYAHLGVTSYDNPPTFNPRMYCTWGSDCHEFLDNYTHKTVTSTSKGMSPEDMVANCYAYQIAWLSHSPKFMDFFTMLTGKPEFADFNFDPYFDRAAQMERERIAREQAEQQARQQATRQAQARVEAEAKAQAAAQAQVVQNAAMRPVEVSKPVATNTPVTVATTPVNATKTDINGVVLPPPTAASLSRGVSIADPNSGHNGKPTRYQVPPHAGDMSDPKPVSPVFVKHEYQGKVPDTDKVNAQGVPLPAGSEHVLDASPFKEPDEFPELNKYTTPVKKMERKLEGRDQIIKNILSQFERPEVCNVILLANAGTGKALVNGTPIAVADNRGYVPIERLKAGDEVFALDGSPASVTGVYPQGEQDVYRVHFADGSVLECNKDHVWPIVRGRVPLGAYKGHRVDEYEDDTDHTRRTGSLMHTLSLHEAKRSSSSLHVYVPANGPIERHSFISAKQRDENGYLIEDLAYLAGLAFGQPVKMCEQSSDDTCVRIKTSRDGVIRALAKDMDTPVEFAADHAMFGLTPRYAAVFNDIKRSSISPFVDMDGRLTGFVSLQSIETRLSILKGIFDARGYMVSNRALTLHVSVCDKSCAKQLLSLLSSVGIRGFMTSRVDPKRTDEYIVQVLNTYDMLMKLVRFDSHGLEARKDTSPSYSRRGVEPFGTRIVKIEKTGKRAQQTCIAVDHPSHCYLAGFMHIPTHNTATVQGTMVADPKRLYLELDLARMLADIEPDQMAAHIKMLFDEVEHFVNKYRREIVVFIDEFHQIVQLSAAAVEALKPVLAASGTRGVRVIAATTYDEFRQYVSPNQPLVERLTRMEIPEPKEDLVVKILKAFATRYGVANDIDEHVYHEIYESTNRYMPAANQPRKSLLLLDSMIGRHRFDNVKIDHDLLADCLMKQEGVNVDLKVDAASIKKRLDARVFDQSIATTAIESALQTAVAGMNDPNKPMATLLFTGSTGVGKQINNDTIIPVFDAENKGIHFKRHGDLQPGDFVFDRLGNPTRVEGVFPNKNVDMYRVTFDDGRTIDVGGDHLWTVYTRRQRSNLHVGKDVTPMVKNTREMLEEGVLRCSPGRRAHMQWYVPANGAVQWSEQDYDVDPYVVGAFIADGCMTDPMLALSSDDKFVVDKVADLIGSPSADKSKSNHTWHFAHPTRVISYGTARIQTEELFGNMPELFNVYSADRRIPKQYMTGSVEQRWRLVQGLFDTDGSVDDTDRLRVSYSTFSKGLAEDVRSLLFSLGIANTITVFERDKEYKDCIRHMTEYTVRVKASFEDKRKFFTLPRKLEVIDKRIASDTRQRFKKFDTVGIRSIEYIGVEDAQCILVDNPEHLYQAGEYIVTHNTEVAKQLSNILFGDGHNMIRFDMSEYANADSLDRFRVHLTQSVWEHPYSVLLLDEIEKANPVITRLLLQVLDDGRLSDQNDRVVNFTNCYIILTTNGGAEIFHTMGRFDQSGRSHSAIDDQKWLDDNLSQIQRSLKETSSSFPPELLGRVGRGIIPFRTLTIETKYRILRQYMASLVARFHTVHGIDVFWQTDDFSSPQSADISNNRVERFLLSDQLDTADASAGGGREVKGVFDSMVLSKISAFVNENPESRACFVRVTGVMRAENKLSRESNAYVEVTAFDPVVDGAHAMSLMDDGRGQMVDMTGVSSSIGVNTSVASGPQSLFDAPLS